MDISVFLFRNVISYRTSNQPLVSYTDLAQSGEYCTELVYWGGGGGLAQGPLRRGKAWKIVDMVDCGLTTPQNSQQWW